MKKTTDSPALFKKQMKTPGFKKEYEDLEEEFVHAKEFLHLRLKAKMSQPELAKRAGTSQPAIARFESGEYQNLSLAFLRIIGKPLGVVPEIQSKQPAITHSLEVCMLSPMTREVRRKFGILTIGSYLPWFSKNELRF